MTKINLGKNSPLSLVTSPWSVFMKQGRDKRIAEEIRREVSQIMHFEVSDPRLMGVTVTGVMLTPDLSLARIYYALPGTEDRKDLVKKSLKKSEGFVRRALAERIEMKFVPRIEFFYDESLEIQSKIHDLFKDTETK